VLWVVSTYRTISMQFLNENNNPNKQIRNE
jgi:hypothetical protein